VFAIGALASHFLSGRHGQVAETTPQKVEAPYAGFLAKLRGVKAGDADVGELATSAVNDLYVSLSGIKDATTAQAALSGLNKASSEFDQLTGLLGQLPPDAHKLWQTQSLQSDPTSLPSWTRCLRSREWLRSPSQRSTQPMLSWTRCVGDLSAGRAQQQDDIVLLIFLAKEVDDQCAALARN
jgi:hypothetical protein